MINEKDFARVEVLELVQHLSSEMHDKSMPDCKMALAVVMAFCIDASKDKEKAKLHAIELIEWVLERAGNANAMQKINSMFGEANYE